MIYECQLECQLDTIFSCISDAFHAFFIWEIEREKNEKMQAKKNEKWKICVFQRI